MLMLMLVMVAVAQHVHGGNTIRPPRLEVSINIVIII